MNKYITVQLLAILNLSGLNTVQAEPTYFQQTLGVHIGYFLTDIDNAATLSGTSNEPGSSLDFSTDLGLNDKINTFKTDIFWRITPKHRLDFTWFGLFQEGKTTIEEDLTIGDSVLPAGSGIISKFNHNRYQFTYTYHLFQGVNYEVGPSIGIYTLNINSEISEVIANEVGRTYSSNDFTLPLPVVGLRGSYGITDKLIIHSSFNFMVLSIGDWSGEIYDFQLAAEYNFLKYVGLGIAYNLSFLNVENDREHYKFRYNYDYQGVQTYLKFAF